jgi:hypothetical protein
MLQPYVQALLSGTLSLGVPLAFAVRELVLLRRGDGGAPRPGDPTPPPLSPAPDDDSSLPPLAACLREAVRDRPLPVAARRRIREHA